MSKRIATTHANRAPVTRSTPNLLAEHGQFDVTARLLTTQEEKVTISHRHLRMADAKIGVRLPARRVVEEVDAQAKRTR